MSARTVQTIFAAAVLAALFLAAGLAPAGAAEAAANCPVPVPAPAAPPAGRYVLLSVDGSPVSFRNPVFIEFATDGALSGVICNTFRGTAAMADGILTLSAAAATRRLCIDAGLSALETRVFAMLGGGVAVIPTEDGLVLRRDGGTLSFRKEQE